MTATCTSVDRPAPWGSGKPCRHPMHHGGSCAATKDDGGKTGKTEHRWWMTPAQRAAQTATQATA